MQEQGIEFDWFASERLTPEHEEENLRRLGALLLIDDPSGLLTRLRAGDQLSAQMVVGATLEQAYPQHEYIIEPVTRLKRQEEFGRWVESVYGLTIQNARKPSKNIVQPRSLTELMTDIVNFKRFNDVLGPKVGDIILREAAAELVGQLRLADNSIAVRDGGDEFKIGVADLEESQARGLWERLCRFQMAKIWGNQQQGYWHEIESAVADLPRPTDYSLRRVRTETVEVAGMQISEKILYIGDRRIVPIHKLTVIDIGYGWGTVASKDDLDRIYNAALMSRAQVKASTHEHVGGAYRQP